MTHPPDIFSAELARDPYPLYRQMRDHFPLYLHAPSGAYVLSRYDDIERALKDPSFTTRSYAQQIEPLLGKTIVQRDGREHSLQRNLLAPSFRAGAIQERFVALISRIARELLDAFRARGEVELIGEFVATYPVRILAAILGLPRSDEARFRSWYSALLRFGLNLVGDPEVTRAGFCAKEELDAYLRPLIEERRRRPGAHLLSMLCSAEIEGERLADDEICRFGMLMIFAGGETTEKMLATCIRNLVAHPRQLEAVRHDRSLVERALAESLRYTAPTHMVPRRTSAAAQVAGGTIPAEAEVICFVGSANRDERKFERPDEFDIFRREIDPARAFSGGAHHLAFGAGRHFCLGAVLSKFEVTIALNQMLDALHDLRFADDQPPPDVGLFLRGPSTLALRFSPTAAAGTPDPILEERS
jgi:pulcherriminic acid synthase